MAKGTADLMVKVRCERIVPVRGGVADLFKKTSVIVTRVIKVVMLPTLCSEYELYGCIVKGQRFNHLHKLHG